MNVSTIYIYIYILIIVGLYFVISTIFNSYKIFSDTYEDDVPEEKQPFVSVLIPARNEQDNIANCVNSFLNQTYKNYEILVLDDNSTDDTHKILTELAKKHPDKLRIFDGKPLPQGWRGKSYAMKQLTEYAKGDVFLFTDADTIHSEKSIELMVTNLIHNNVDMVSGYITQKLNTFGEKVANAALSLLTTAIPIWLNEKVKLTLFSTAVGQYIGVKKSSFMAIGGYDEIKNITTEDVYLARRMKKCGYKTAFLDFTDAAECHMYSGFKESVNGISKNIFDFTGKNNFVMLFFVVAITFFLFGPCVMLGIELFKYFTITHIMSNLLIALIFVNASFFISWFLVFSIRKFPLWLSLFYPVIFACLLYLVIVSWVKGNSTKGYMWKGRVVS